MAMSSLEGPGRLHGYVTGTFGQPQRVFDSSDGAAAREDAIDLPMDAHTHMSWAFTDPGVYRMGIVATWGDGALGGSRQAGGQLVIDVGGSGHEVPGREGATVIDAGHADITADVDVARILLRVDAPGGAKELDVEDVVLQVPTRALMPVPSDPASRFIARPGTDVYQLPQAVLGRHVHGEVDPHLWHDVTNAQA